MMMFYVYMCDMKDEIVGEIWVLQTSIQFCF